MIRSQSQGHPAVFVKGHWIYEDNGKPADSIRPCARCGRLAKGVMVKIPADLSHTGKKRWAWKEIDSCIAPIVKAIQRAGIDMRSSCCGHGNGDGEIMLQNGRILIIRRAT